MTIDSFGRKDALIRKHFEKYKNDKTKPEHSAVCELFNLYDSAMGWLYSEEEKKEGPEMEKWRDQLSMAGIKAHKLYLNLRGNGVNVEHNKTFLKNRQEGCGCSPDKLEFYQFHPAIEDLLCFCILGTTDTKEIKKMKKELGIND